jgi:tetratricopeptide (TPR) repeat protein
MIINNKIPIGSIKVVPFFKNEWRFEFSRLDDRVYEMFHDALDDFDTGKLIQAERSLRLLLDGYPEFIDAYHHLAMILDETRRYKEARQVWENAVIIGKSAFPKTEKRVRLRLPWGILDNRPFLRVYHSWGLQLIEEEKVTDALVVFNDILSMNPNDNQGIRALAIGCYFQLNQPTQVLAVCKRYPNDAMEEVLYGHPLALFQLGREQEARSTLRKAIEILPNISKELLKKTHRPPKNLSLEYVTHGGADQAYYYWKNNGEYWIYTKGALEFLRSVLTKY